VLRDHLAAVLDDGTGGGRSKTSPHRLTSAGSAAGPSRRAMPAALLIINLGAPFRIRGGTDMETAEYADGCVVTTPARALEFGYPLRTRSVGVHVTPCPRVLSCGTGWFQILTW
jgi:hypothetical protein